MAGELKYIANMSDVVPGTILFFQTAKDLSPVQRLIMFLQTVLSPFSKKGHIRSTHVAVVIENKDGEVIILHVTEFAGSVKLRKDNLKNMVRRQGGRCLLAATPSKQELRDNIVDVCQETFAQQKKHSIYWSVIAAVWAFIKPSRLFYRINKKKKNWMHDQRMICSEFALRVLKTATARMEDPNAYKNYFPEVRSDSSPKALEHELRSKNYEFSAYTDSESLGSPYLVLKKEISKQIDILYLNDKHFKAELKANNFALQKQLRLSKNEAKIGSTKKSDMCHLEFTKLIKVIENSNFNELEKAMYLVKHMSPFLKKQTNWWSFRDPSAYSSVTNVARNMGVFREDIERFNKELEVKPVEIVLQQPNPEAEHAAVGLHLNPEESSVLEQKSGLELEPSREEKVTPGVLYGVSPEGMDSQSRVVFHPRRGQIISQDRNSRVDFSVTPKYDDVIYDKGKEVIPYSEDADRPKLLSPVLKPWEPVPASQLSPVVDQSQVAQASPRENQDISPKDFEQKVPDHRVTMHRRSGRAGE